MLGGQECRHLRRGLHLYQGLRHDHQLPVLPWNVEVVHVVRKMVAVAEHPAAWAYERWKVRQRWFWSLRGCIRVSIMLSLTELLYRNFVKCRSSSTFQPP